jgi:aspartate carbamoyltransferase catalytic subunit
MMNLKNADVLTAAQFTRDQVEALFARADEFTARMERG